jgi:hypothetical protein
MSNAPLFALIPVYLSALLLLPPHYFEAPAQLGHALQFSVGGGLVRVRGAWWEVPAVGGEEAGYGVVGGVLGRGAVGVVLGGDADAGVLDGDAVACVGDCCAICGHLDAPYGAVLRWLVSRSGRVREW